MTLEIVIACVAGLLVTAGVGVWMGRRPGGTAIVYGLSLAASGIALAVALVALGSTGHEASSVILPIGLPWLGAHLRLDALAAFFLIVVNLGGAAASLFGLGQGTHEHAPHRVLPFYPAYLAGMNLVILADDAFTFLLAWEFMSLVSWALVMAHHRDRGNAHAGFVYLVMASFGTLALLLAFGMMAGPDGGYAFQSIRDHPPTEGAAALTLVLVLIGAGSKAGLVPLHIWLPLAHPAAPSHVSALMSGVMTKVAVYGFVRVVFDLLGTPDWWWSMLVLGLATATAVLGVLHALMQHDLKRLLAYHTIENIGIIFIGLGLALAFEANGMRMPAALALTAALLHVLNHGLFKSLLFLGSGAVLMATGERDMERLGGLIGRMPATAVAFLIGCIAISALPPLNGFVSEWLTFQAMLLTPELPQWGLRFLVPAVCASLALSAALAAACFVKAYGVVFLGRPRTAAAEVACEVDRFTLAAMASLAALCVVLGVLPGFAIDRLAAVVAPLAGAAMPGQVTQPWLSLVPIATGRSSYNGLVVLLFILVSAGVLGVFVRRFAAHGIRRGPAWDCGFPSNDSATQYTAGSFAQPIRRVFGTLAFRAKETVDMPRPGEMRPARLEVRLQDLIWSFGYIPLVRGVTFVGDRFNVVQSLTIRRYLTLVFGALVGLLLVLALWT